MPTYDVEIFKVLKYGTTFAVNAPTKYQAMMKAKAEAEAKQNLAPWTRSQLLLESFWIGEAEEVKK